MLRKKLHIGKAKQHFPQNRMVQLCTNRSVSSNECKRFYFTDFSCYLNNLFIAQPEKVKVSEKVLWWSERGKFESKK